MQGKVGSGPNGEAARRHPLYSLWHAMRNRCNNPRNECFDLYGKRGIKVCAAWNEDFWKFVDDVSPRPSPKHSLDRKDNDQGYEPSNVRWATQAEQLRNQSRNRLLTINGRTQCLTDWANECGIKKGVLASRIDALGWTPERAVSTPVRNKRNQARVAYNEGPT